MLRHAMSHGRLMRESTDRVQAALSSSDRNEQLIARRVLESTVLWQQWEHEHSSLMRQLANCGVRHAQVAALKQTTFRLLHGKALFQFLRQSAMRGAQRAQVLAHFRPGRSFASAIIAEHGAYLRRACSYLCTSHLGSEVVQDPAFLDPMQRYEELYTEYFNLYCTALVESDGAMTFRSAAAAAEAAVERIPVGHSRSAGRPAVSAAGGGTAPADGRYAAAAIPGRALETAPLIDASGIVPRGAPAECRQRGDVLCRAGDLRNHKRFS